MASLLLMCHAEGHHAACMHACMALLKRNLRSALGCMLTSLPTAVASYRLWCFQGTAATASHALHAMVAPTLPSLPLSRCCAGCHETARGDRAPARGAGTQEVAGAGTLRAKCSCTWPCEHLFAFCRDHLINSTFYVALGRGKAGMKTPHTSLMLHRFV